MSRPRVGIYGLTSCAGDQLVWLNCEDELLPLVEAIDLRSFLMADSLPEEKELDIAFVEGVVAQPHDLEVLQDIRQRTKFLVALGTCAVWGGIPGAIGKQVAFPPAPLSQHVKVDWSLSGCPVEKEELLAAITSFLHGDLPWDLPRPVCTECRIRENDCLLQAGGFCAGPLTRGGCGARCPSHNRGCLGCRGPVPEANLNKELRLLLDQGYPKEELVRRLGTFARHPRWEEALAELALWQKTGKEKKHVEDIA